MLNKLELARYYNEAPIRDNKAEMAYAQLARECYGWAWDLTRQLSITIVNESEPYYDAREMFQDLVTGNLRVSGINSAHPLWTPEDNTNFRIVHDVMGHWNNGNALQCGFSWTGEVQAYTSQAHRHSPLAQRALFTEVVGQTAYYSTNRHFPTQKAFIYPEELRHV